jgi:hypothetical protein
LDGGAPELLGRVPGTRRLAWGKNVIAAGKSGATLLPKLVLTRAKVHELVATQIVFADESLGWIARGAHRADGAALACAVPLADGLLVGQLLRDRRFSTCIGDNLQ